MYKRTALVLAALALAAGAAAAQEAALSLDQIVVTATRIAGTILASPDHVTVVSGEELAGAISVAAASANSANAVRLNMTEPPAEAKVQSV